MTFAPRAAFGIPVYNHAHQLRRTLESILSQSFGDLGILVVDDCSTDETPQILAEYAALDPRLKVVRNERQHGYTRNAMKTWRLARESFPSIEYFAWGSDHDLWHPDWLRLLVAALDAAPEAPIAWSWYHRIGAEGEMIMSRREMLGRGGSADRTARVRYVGSGAAAGSCIYSLIRVPALERTSGLRLVLVPDRLLLAELAALGPFVEVPEYLWHRRYAGLASGARQRRSSFPGGAPLYTHLPVWAQHLAVLAQDWLLRGLGPPELSWPGRLRLLALYTLDNASIDRRRRDNRAAMKRRKQEARDRERAARKKTKAKEPTRDAA
ncbi:Glycosyltransferase involved in cell wall bisynthesis [Tistlia consotensis]|uniref:Glycosyltransferase involved in cell wall bisynthesis n=1 Tax=Tistlia consotensis USBA 355 TaxID=560819 RepID=A0A1Y6BEC8_9PROT|nr:glycosyltransferase family 2 protein [Tistlia consotensis]SME99206.1 Glycosyltransferase involved in cell wall bisynthesis [Tistlia consotensis USBA 355]SNR77280.1 Glycosyltransferase involved in cell wall bisynthesis [Tistlia consotensis]